VRDWRDDRPAGELLACHGHPKVGQQRGRPRRETAFSAQIPRPRL